MTTSFDDLRAFGIDPVEEIVWDEAEPLRPGMDFHDGIVYFTIPGKRNVEVTKGKGKAATTEIKPVDHLILITSQGVQIPYDAENVTKLGFSFPQTVVNDRVRRWSSGSIKAFLNGEATVPDPATIHTGLRRVYEDYIEFAKGADDPMYDIMPIFIMGSYVFRLYKSLGYLHYHGTAASGKSQNLRILNALGFNTQWASSLSAAALYRQVAGMPGVLCLDEAEGFEGERGEELRRILNAGYIDGSRVGRAEKNPDDTWGTMYYDTYGPKALASINPLDIVIGSRCIVVSMRPAIRTIPEFDKDDERWQKVRDRLYLWAMFHAPRLNEVITEWNEHTRVERAPALIGRQWQITQLYITIADYIDSFDDGDRCNRLIDYFNTYFAEQQRALEATDRARLILKCLPTILRELPAEEGGFYNLKRMHEIVVEQLDSDAVEYFKTRQLSKNLDVLGFRNKRTRKGGTQVFIDADRVREELRLRRVEPNEEDRAWYAGEVEYGRHITPVTRPTEERASLWAAAAEDEE